MRYSHNMGGKSVQVRILLTVPTHLSVLWVDGTMLVENQPVIMRVARLEGEAQGIHRLANGTGRINCCLVVSIVCAELTGGSGKGSPSHPHSPPPNTSSGQ